MANKGKLDFDWTRRVFLGAAASVSSPATAQVAGQPITCRVIDQSTGRPVPARVRLVDQYLNDVVPVGHSATLSADAQEGDVRFQGRRYSYVNGEVQVAPRRLPRQ